MPEFLLKRGDESTLAAVIRRAIGVTEDEDVCVTTPTFDRPVSWLPPMGAPSALDVPGWFALLNMTREDLRDWGCRAWGLMTTQRPLKERPITKEGAWFFETDDAGIATHELWLLPAEWYDRIPNGFPLVDIFGTLESFERGKTSDDRRYGLLAYGVVVPFLKQAGA